MTLEFTTKLERGAIELLFENTIVKNEQNINVVECDYIYISYSIEFELREYGIKSTYITVDKCDFSIYQEDDSCDGARFEGFEKTFSIDDFEIEVSKDDMTVDFISITSAEIDFQDMTIKFY